MKIQRIGIFGGTFDPIHAGHLVMAQMARESMRMDKVFFVPCCLPPHKNTKQLISARDRLRMVRLAIAGNSGFAVSDFEVKKGGKSYSIDTARFFRRRFPKPHKLFFIVGKDAFEGLAKWKDIDCLLSEVEFVVVNRAGYHQPASARIKHASVIMPSIDISSSYVRGQLKQGKTVRYLVPDKVAAYLKEHRLYP